MGMPNYRSQHRSRVDPSYKLLLSAVFVFTIFMIGIIGYLILGEGQWSALDCAYMTVITLTTVGFTEVLDISHNPAARVFTMGLILVGMGAFLFFVSNLTAFIVEGHMRDILWRKRMYKNLSKISDHIIVCGLGETGLHVAREIILSGREIVLIDLSEERLQNVCDTLDLEIPYVVGDASDDDILQQAGIMRANGIVAACTEDKDNMFIIVSAKNLNAGIRVVTKAITVQSERKLRRAGADKVVTTNRIGGMRLASEMMRPTVTTFLDRMLHKSDKTQRLDEVPIKAESPFIGKTLIDLDIRRKLNLTIVALELKLERKYLYNPEPTLQLAEGMTLICLGEVKAINQLRSMAEAS